jgi:hypothetical protein
MHFAADISDVISRVKSQLVQHLIEAHVNGCAHLIACHTSLPSCFSSLARWLVGRFRWTHTSNRMAS